MFETLIYNNMFMAFLPDLILGIVIFLVFYFAGSIARRIIAKIGSTGKVGRQNVYLFLASSTRIGLIVFGLITSLGTMGIDITALVTGLGLTSLAIGLALKDAVTNLLNGILILLYEPFKQGDKVSIGGKASGVIGEINLRYTQVIDEAENKEHLVPNSIANSQIITREMK